MAQVGLGWAPAVPSAPHLARIARPDGVHDGGAYHAPAPVPAPVPHAAAPVPRGGHGGHAVGDQLYMRPPILRGKAEISYKRCPIPTAEGVVRWIAELESTPAQGAKDMTTAADYATRFAMLAYSRNCGRPTQGVFLASEGSELPDLFEIQIHGTDKCETGAHLVAYIYKLPAGGCGVVLTFKGSTMNLEDWKRNLHVMKVTDDSVTRGVELFPDLAGVGSIREARVHPGFLKYTKTLFARMQKFSVKPLQEMLRTWGCPESKAENFLDWLYEGPYAWCACAGHSLGAAMAAVAATDITVRSGKNAFLAVVGSPSVGNEAFMSLQNSYLLPAGGLRIHNRGDPITFMGFSGISVKAKGKCHAGRGLLLDCRTKDRLDPFHVHLRCTMPSDVFGMGLSVTFKFPGSTYKPSGSTGDAHFLGEHWNWMGDVEQHAGKGHGKRAAGRRRAARAPGAEEVYPMHFQFSVGEGEEDWQDYGREEQQRLCMAVMESRPGITLRLGSQEYFVDFENMVQKNKVTGREREIRMVFA